jgi:hypothetical protein
MEPPAGLEPATYALQVRCSTTELKRQTGHIGIWLYPCPGFHGNRQPSTERNHILAISD